MRGNTLVQSYIYKLSEKVWENMFYLDIWISPCKFTIQRKSVFSALNPAECAIF